MAGRDDPMSGLLSGLSGIDSSLFRKNESMTNARTRKTVQQPPKPAAADVRAPLQASSGIGSGFDAGLSSSGAAGYASAPSVASRSSAPMPQPLGARTSSSHDRPAARAGGDPFLANQLDAFSGLDVTAAPRPMRAQAQLQTSSSTSTAGAGGLLGVPQRSAPAAANPGPGLGSYSPADDLDMLFSASTPPQSASAASSANDLVDLGFGAPPQAGPPRRDFGAATTSDLLGVGLPSPGSAASSQLPVADEDALDDFFGGRAAATDAASPFTASSQPVEEEYNSILQRARSHSKEASTTATPPDQIFPSFERVRVAPTTDAMPMPVRQPAPTPPAANSAPSSGTFFERLDADAAYAPPSPAAPASRTSSRGVGDDASPPPPSYNQVMYGGTQQERPGASPPSTGAAHAQSGAQKQAEKLGKWLGASAKKLAKAAQQKAKEVQAKLDELEKTRRVGGYGEQFSDQAEPELASAPMPAPRPAPAASTAGGSIVGDGNGSGGVGDIPQHYYEWAATIATIQDAPDRRRVLMGMPEGERLVMVRLLQAQGIADPLANSDGGGRAERAAGAAAGEALQRPASAPSPASPRERPVVARARPATPEQQLPKKPAAVAAAPQEDLLSPGTPRAATGGSNAAQSAAAVSLEADLLGMSGSDAAPGSASTAPAPPSAGGGLDDFLSGPSSTPAAAGDDDFAAMFNAPRPGMAAAGGGGGGGGPMIDFGGGGGGAAAQAYSALYRAEEGDMNEPELRRAAREKRLAEMHGRMRQKLDEKLTQEQSESDEKALKVELRTQYKAKIDAWSHQKKDNIRALLSSVHTVLWEGSGWKQPSMADVLEAQKVKRWYMKANLIVHPDKVKQKGGSVEQLTVAEMVFDVLKQAWAKFEAAELR